MLIFALSLLPATTSVPYASYAATLWYVAPNGNDSNSCSSPSAPCATINGAMAKAASGDTINVAGGTYYGNGNEVVLLNKSLTLSGGWDGSFSTRNQELVIHGMGARIGVSVNAGVLAIMDSFAVQNSLTVVIANTGTLTVVACDIAKTPVVGSLTVWMVRSTSIVAGCGTTYMEQEAFGWPTPAAR